MSHGRHDGEIPGHVRVWVLAWRGRPWATFKNKVPPSPYLPGAVADRKKPMVRLPMITPLAHGLAHAIGEDLQEALETVKH